MDKTLDLAFSAVDRDLSTEWLALTDRVRRLSQEIHQSTATEQTALLSREVSSLCNYVERLHQDVAELLGKLDEKPLAALTPAPDSEEAGVLEEPIQIRRESHELRADFKDILKALFMWQDDPVERAREKKSQ